MSTSCSGELISREVQAADTGMYFNIQKSLEVQAAKFCNKNVWKYIQQTSVGILIYRVRTVIHSLVLLDTAALKSILTENLELF